MAQQHPSRIHAASCAMSGHVNYTAQQIQFFGMVDRKINARKVLRDAGVLKVKRARNPMAAEKTPRKERGFDYSIPTGRKDLKDWDRWEYPEVDFGLMGKFASQKKSYANFIGTLDDYKAATKKADEEREIAREEAARAKAVAAGEGRKTARDRDLHSARDTYREETARQPPVPVEESAISNHSIKTFKVLGGPHPEVLENWRAKRAAEFLKKKAHPLDPPSKKSLSHTRDFLPGGYFHEEDPDYGDHKYSPPKPHKKVLGALVPHAKNTDIHSMKESLSTLMNALDRTETDLKRQELALGLNARKKKGYEMPSSSRRSSRAASDVGYSP